MSCSKGGYRLIAQEMCYLSASDPYMGSNGLNVLMRALFPGLRIARDLKDSSRSSDRQELKNLARIR